MSVTWIIQTNMGSQSDILQYVEGVRQSGAKVIEVEYIPFSGQLPEMDADGPVVLYGAVDFIKVAKESGRWPLGVFGDIDTFTYENWAKHYGDMLLNSPKDTELMQVGDFSLEGRNPEDLIFVRPQHDTKSLVGSVMSVQEFYTWSLEARKGLFANVNYDTPIVVAKPYGISAEWRLFVVNNEVVASSQYHKKGRLFKSEGAPGEVLDFARKVIDTWSPVPAYVLDIGMSANNYYIIEAQGFNSAGVYAANVKDIADAVNKVAIDLWNKQKNSPKI